MKLESVGQILDVNPYMANTTSTASSNLGDLVNFADRRSFRYGKAGAAATSPGKLEVAPTPKTNHHNLTPTAAAAVGATQITVTLGATLAAVNEYAEGYAIINVTPGVAQVFKISGHPAANSAATLTLTLFDPIVTALTTTSRVTLVHNAYNAFIESTSVTQRPAGVPLIAFAAGNYGWVQTAGMAGVLAGATIALGSEVVSDGSTAGAVAQASATIATYLTQSKVGLATIAGVTTEYRPIMLTLDSQS